ncbi:MAG TPA: helix-turn-helix domain-containing protein [Blastocatellia bacterium]
MPLAGYFVNVLLHNMRVDTENLVSQSTAAKMRGVTKQSIQRLIKRGSLRSITIDGHTFLFRSEVEKFVPSKGGRPRVSPQKKPKK